jgi:hypothetical protein
MPNIGRCALSGQCRRKDSSHHGRRCRAKPFPCTVPGCSKGPFCSEICVAHHKKQPHFAPGTVLLVLPFPVSDDLASIGTDPTMLEDVRQLVDHLTGESMVIETERAFVDATDIQPTDKTNAYLPVLMEMKRCGLARPPSSASSPLAAVYTTASSHPAAPTPQQH